MHSLVRVCLATSTLTDPAADRVRPAGELARVVAESLEPLRRAGDYARLGRNLPDVIDELHYHAAASGEETRRTARLNYADLAQLAAARAADAAARLGMIALMASLAAATLQAVPPGRSGCS